jgi:hypothetical protein
LAETADRRNGALGFVDDYTGWTISDTVEENMETPGEKVIPRALEWAKKSGAKFEGEKSTLIHSTHWKSSWKISQPLQALRVGDAKIALSQSVRMLGVVSERELTSKSMQTELPRGGGRRYRQ